MLKLATVPSVSSMRDKPSQPPSRSQLLDKAPDNACVQHANSLAARIDALLPQTQCARCGYPGCRPYAEALANGSADINQCPPGGEATIEALAALLGVATKPLNPANGVEAAIFNVALIAEQDCIGCFKCVLACPVDAIVGAPKLMHTVIAAQCSSCDLCLPVCPVDCITMIPRSNALPEPSVMAPRWRSLFDAQQQRRARDEAALESARRQQRVDALKTRASDINIQASIARARARRSIKPAS